MGTKRLLPLLALLALLSACAPATPVQETGEPELTLAATTYPVYLFACQVAGDVPGLRVTLVVNQQLSCMHDYSLSITDMKVLEGADAVLLNGAGLEDAMSDALAAAGRPQIDCSAGIDLLCTQHDHDHDHHHGAEELEEAGEEADPHIWLDPRRACQMLDNLAQALGELDPAHAGQFTANAQAAQEEILKRYAQLKAQLAQLEPRALITFHDGFSYFAEAFNLTILEAIEEESGSEASAREVKDILALLEEHRLPAIFTEVNGATATAQLIGREAGVAVAPLDLLMSSRESALSGTDLYLSVLAANVSTIQEAYSCA